MQGVKIPGYTGFRPTEETFTEPNIQKDGTTRIPGITVFHLIYLIGYSGYVPGVKSENVFGESYGKTSG